MVNGTEAAAIPNHSPLSLTPPASEDRLELCFPSKEFQVACSATIFRVQIHRERKSI